MQLLAKLASPLIKEVIVTAGKKGIQEGLFASKQKLFNDTVSITSSTALARELL